MPLVLRHNLIGAEVAPPALAPARARRLSAIVKRHAPKDRPYIVSVHRRGQTLRPTDDTVKMRAAWASTLVGKDETIVITQVPMGGGAGAGGGNAQAKQIGGAIALVALAIAAPYALGAIAPAIFGVAGALTAVGQAAVAGIVIGGAYLIGKITQAKANQNADANRPLYGVSGGGNLPRPGDRIPVGYGAFVAQPDLSQPDFSIYDGEDQLLYKRLTLGLGKYQVHKIEIGTATLWTEDDGVVAPFLGAIGGDSAGERGAGIGGGSSSSGGGTDVEVINPGDLSSLVPASVYSSPSVGGSELPRFSENPAWAGPFRASPVGQTTSRLQIDFSYPQGVSFNQGPAFFSVLFQYAPCDDDNNPTGAWSTLVSEGGESYTTKGVRNTRIVDVPAGNYIVRGQNGNAEGPSGYLNSATWDGLRSHFPDTIARPHVTEIAIKVRSGKNLGVAAFGDVWVTATRIVPTWNGSAWVDAATRKAVYAFKDIMQASYGAGLVDSEVDLDRIKFYAGELSQFDTFDGIIRGPVSVFEAANSVLGPMRAETTRIANTWSINRDEERTVRKHVLSRRQIVRGSSSSSFKIARDDGAADVIGEYAPGGDGRRRRDLRVTFGSQSLTPSRVQLVGVSDHDHAHHVLTWKAAAAYYRRERRKVTVDRRGRLISRGDPALVDSWFMSDARAAGILARSTRTLTLDTDVVVDDATYASLRARDNRQWGPVKVTAGANAHTIVLDADDVAAAETATTITLADALADDTMEMTTVLVGPLAEQQDAFLIDSVAPQGRDRVAIEAVFDHPSVWDALGEAPPAEPTLPSLGDLVAPDVPLVPWVSARCVQKGVSLVMEWAVGSARGAASYAVSISYDDGDTWEAAFNGLDTAGSYPLRGGDGVTVAVGAWAISRAGVPGPAVYTNFETFRPAVNSDTANLFVDPVALAAEVRGFYQSVSQQLEDIKDFVGAVVGEQDAQNFKDQFRTGRQSVERDETLQVGIDGASASIATHETLIVSLEGSFASLSSTVTSNYNAQQAQIASNATAITGLSGSFSSFSTSVTASLGSLSAGVTTNSNAIVTVNGRLAAFYGLHVDANGLIASIELASDGTVAPMKFKATSFQFSFPGYADLGLTLGLVAGVASLGWSGNALLDGILAARQVGANQLIANSANIANATITTLHAVGEAWTAIRYAVGSNYSGGENSGAHDLVSITKTITDGQVLILATFNISAFDPPNVITLRLKIDGATQEDRSTPIGVGDNNPSGGGNLVACHGGTYTVQFVATGLSNASHTFTFAVVIGANNFGTGTRASTGSNTVNRPTITILEPKR